MRFGPWYPLAEAATHAVAGPGVLQVRVATGLGDYPRGKSAMIHYQAAADVRAAAVALAAHHPAAAVAAWWCRHTIEPVDLDDATATALAASLVEAFMRRFGQAPRWP